MACLVELYGLLSQLTSTKKLQHIGTSKDHEPNTAHWNRENCYFVRVDYVAYVRKSNLFSNDLSLQQVTRLENQLSTLKETAESQTKRATDLNNKLKQVIYINMSKT